VRVDEARVVVALEEARVLEHAQVERDRGLDALHDELLERPAQAVDRLAAVAAPGHELRHHRVVVHRDGGALEHAAVDADADPVGRPVREDPARRRREVLVGVLGVDARLDRVARDAQVLLPEGERLARRDADHLLHDVDAGDRLGDRVLDLDPRVHLEEVEVPLRVHEELDRAGAAVADRARRGDGGLAHALAPRGRHAVGGRLLDHLLVPALDRALALEEVHGPAVAVGQHLDLDVPRLFDELLHVQTVVAERGARLAARARRRGRDLGLAAHEPHALAAAARGGLDHDGRTDVEDPAPDRLVRQALRGAGHDRHAGLLHRLARGHLVAHAPHHVARRPDEDDAFLVAQVREGAVLGEEAVAGVDRLGLGAPRDLEDAVHAQVRLARRRRSARVSLVGEADVQRVAVDVGVDRDRRDPELAAGADDAHGDLAAVGDQDLVEHRRSSGRGMRRPLKAGCSRASWAGSRRAWWPASRARR
jgi:hypothetical protein